MDEHEIIDYLRGLLADLWHHFEMRGHRLEALEAELRRLRVRRLNYDGALEAYLASKGRD